MKNHRVGLTVLIIAWASALSSCTSIESVRVDQNRSEDGLTYFLPLRDIAVTVTEPDSGPATIAVQAADARPDLQHAFVARIPRSAIGNNKATIQVSSQGLLNSDSSAEFTSSLTTILQGAAGIVAFSEGPAAVSKPACSPGTYTHILRFRFDNGAWQLPKPDTSFCGFDFVVTAPPQDPKSYVPAATLEPPTGTARAGLFYRLAIPYLVTVTPSPGTGTSSSDSTPQSREFLVFSPTGSNTHFLPVARGAFATNDASFSFDNGVPTKYGQTIQSELVGLVGLPATLLQSYFKSIGDIFGARKTSLDAQKDYLDSLNALAIERQKRAACSSAVAANDSARIATDCK